MANQTKKYNKFIVSSVAATLVGSAVAPIAGFAAEANKDFSDVAGHWAKEAIDYLVGKEAINGYEDGTFKPDGQITRAEAAKILAATLGLEIDENAKTDFEDAKDHWASAYIAAIQDQKAGVINGYENDTFRPDNKITRQEMAKMIASAYGLELNENAVIDFNDNTSWGEEQVNILASLGVVQGQAEGTFAPEANVTRGETATFVHRAEVEDVRKEVELKVVDPVVESVKSINAKQMEITFNKAIDADTVIEDEDGNLVEDVITLDTVGNDTLEVTALTGELSEDGKTLTLTAGTDEIFDGRYSIAVVGVEGVDGEKVNDYAGFFSADDVTAPTIASVERENPTTLNVNFSEPMASEGTVSFKYEDGTVVESANFDLDETGLFGTVDLSSEDVEENEEITVQFIGAKDFAGNLLTPNPSFVSVQKGEKDGVAPGVEALNVLAPNQFEIRFSEEVQGLTADDFTVSGGALVSKVEQNEDDKTLYTLTLNTSLDGVKTITLADQAVADLSGEENEEYSKLVQFDADENAPELAGVTVKQDEEDGKEYLVLSFNKAVSLTDEAIVLTGSKVKDYVTTKDVQVTIPAEKLVSVEESTSEYRVALADLTDSFASELEEDATYTLDLPANIATNVSGETNELETGAIVFTRTEDKDVSEVEDQTVVSVAKGDGNSTVIVDFGKDVEGATATDVGNYSIDGAEVEKAEILDSTNPNLVTLTLKEGTVTFTGERNWTISGVKADDGAALESDAKGTITLTENVAPTVVSAKVIGEDTIELTFSEAVTSEELNNFEIFQDTDELLAEVDGNAEAFEGNKKVVVTLAEGLNSLNDIIVKAADTIDIIDGNGNMFDFEEIEVK